MLNILNTLKIARRLEGGNFAWAAESWRH